MAGERNQWMRGILGGTAQLSIRGGCPPSQHVASPPAIAFDRAIAEKPVRLDPPQGWRASEARRVDLVFLIDDSGSMYGTFGDPRGIRRAAALSVMSLLAAATPRSLAGARIGVVHFGSTAPDELILPLTDVRRRLVLERALALPLSLGATNVAAALTRGREILVESADRLPLVVVVTDGIEFVGDEVATEVNALPSGVVHVVLVDHGHGCDSELEECWSRLALGSFVRLDVLDTARMAWQAAEVVARAVGLAMPQPLTLQQQPTRR